MKKNPNKTKQKTKNKRKTKLIIHRVNCCIEDRYCKICNTNISCKAHVKHFSLEKKIIK